MYDLVLDGLADTPDPLVAHPQRGGDDGQYEGDRGTDEHLDHAGTLQGNLRRTDVTCRIQGDCGVLPSESWDAAYRVIQEGLTNALKHAPGAPVEVTLSEDGTVCQLAVRNGAPRLPRRTALAGAGGGNGIGGMRARLAACGGELVTGPTDEGGWLVSARLPVRVG
jgi:signal transduction histidine kinase